MPLAPGTRLGPFEVVALLGVGGMGEVYRGRDVRLGREVALKVLPAHLLAERDRLARFAQEARAASNLNHPNVVTIHEVGQANGVPFIAMELVEGRGLRDVLREGPLPLRRFLDLAAQLAEGVARAHEAGLVHRDLKPENVMLTRDGFVKILDFGLAKLAAGPGDAAPAAPGDQALTAAGLVVGSPGYMSPEQASGRPLDARSDQFSLGLVFYEMLTGRRAFQRGTAVQTLTAIIQDEPEPIHVLNPRVPAPVRWIVERCLSKEPDERYAATRDLARDLRHLARNLEALGVAESTASHVAPAVTTRLAAVTGAAPASRPGAAAPAAAASEPPAAAREPLLVRAGRVVGSALLALAVLAGAALGGYWLHSRLSEEAPRYRGDLVLGGSAQALSPRVSPDGKRVAFLTSAGGVAQVGVLDPASGDWTVLTRGRDAGSADKCDWSSDSSRIYFDRIAEARRGVWSVPAIGGEERLLLEDAQGPEGLPDGSLLVARLDGERNFRLHRFRPDTNRLEPVGPAVLAESQRLTFRAFPDGREALVFGRFAVADAAPDRRVWLLDLGSGAVRPLTSLPVVPPFCPTASGEVLAVLRQADLHQVVALARTGDSFRPLLSLTSQPWYLGSAPDGSLYVSLRESPGELLRFPEQGGLPEHVATTAASLAMTPAELPDGRLFLPALTSGRRLLLAGGADGGFRPVVDARDWAMPPVTLIGAERFGFLLGGRDAPPLLAVASAADGRILDRLELPGKTAPKALAASGDGKTVFLAEAGSVWALDLLARQARKLCPGDGVAVSPLTGELVVQRNERDGVRFFSVRPADATERELLYQSAERVATSPLSGRAVALDGRILVTLSSGSSGYWGPGILDPGTAAVTRIPVRFDGDVLASSWSARGDVLAMGVGQRGELWRFERLP